MRITIVILSLLCSIISVTAQDCILYLNEGNACYEQFSKNKKDNNAINCAKEKYNQLIECYKTNPSRVPEYVIDRLNEFNKHKTGSKQDTKAIKYEIIEKTKYDTVYIDNVIYKIDTLTIVTIYTDTIYIQQPINYKFNYIPFGVHQFTKKQTGKGIFFAATEGIPLVVGIAYYISAQHNLSKHKDPKYEDWERDRFYDKYEHKLKTSYWWFAGTGLMIALNYCDNFNWFRHRINDSTSATIIPSPMVDWQGKPQMAMTLSIKF
ncbi:MAG: hypothetical protein LBG92_00750 [Prevotellaceae bacterium]|jgi:hypothetical protein|nr:hypothetical protein [Prevotellaceae bacterium]